MDTVEPCKTCSCKTGGLLAPIKESGDTDDTSEYFDQYNEDRE